MENLYFLLLAIFIILLIPSLIVIIWKRRPVWAFFLASTVISLTVAVPDIINTFEAIVILDTSDPTLKTRWVLSALIRALMVLPILLPILALIQWAARRKYKRNMRGKPAADTFS